MYEHIPYIIRNHSAHLFLFVLQRLCNLQYCIVTVCMLAMYNLNCMFSGMEGCRRGTVQMGTLQRGFARRKIGAITIQVQTNEGMNARSAKI